MAKIFFNRTKELEADIENYLEMIENAALIFNEGVKNYINSKLEQFQRHYDEIIVIENSADEIRREIKHRLYTYMLIPESRGDVLGLLETLDNVVDITKKVMEQFSIEKPQIPDILKSDFIDLAELSCKSVEELVKATRAFFSEIKIINNYINKVHFYEHEADKIEEQLKRKAFTCEEFTEFSRRVHMRYFAERIALISDEAEEVADRLAVYAIKRRI